MLLSAKFAALIVFVVGVQAETHTVVFVNRCGRGTPRLKRNGVTLSTGGPYTSNGCGADGEGCTMVETTLVNPTTPGSGSSTDITLIPPHEFSVTTGFGYYNGCDGTNPSCPLAFRKPSDTFAQVACQADNVNLAITFCD
ncbi:glycopeptide [Lentinula raphanica]|uniref:Glycopeptide n=1 Tax=Lentinula raphanica TaxID=153919 RepID=A0AA38NVS8_9AGAR|nr:glycopeptide [Lentinula raphanica]